MNTKNELERYWKNTINPSKGALIDVVIIEKDVNNNNNNNTNSRKFAERTLSRNSRTT